MDRLLEKDLVNWKEQTRRKPLLIDGARQVGKTYLLKTLFGTRHFERVHCIDLRRERNAHTIFEGNISAKNIFQNTELYLKTKINPHTDLLFFDEIGEHQPAIDALKYIAEEAPHSFVCSSGSNIGLLDSFPVGKVQIANLYPLNFEEFLRASNNSLLFERFQDIDRSSLVHEQLWEHLLDYYFVGGMPEAVSAWWTDDTLESRITRVSEIHNQLLQGYENDFGKYSGSIDAFQIAEVFRNIPIQLASVHNDSAKRYRFKGVIPKKNRYSDLVGPISWLERARLILKNFPVETPISPLKSRMKSNIFKLFLMDVGLLGRMLDISYLEQHQQKLSFKGYIAENFVQQGFTTIGYSPTYSWQKGSAEIEFLFKDALGNIIPIEVKSGSRTKAQSLRSYSERYSPPTIVKLIGSAGGVDISKHMTLPLYYASRIPLLVQGES